MFVANSVNNILTIMNGLDYYFDKAGLNGDYFIVSRIEAGWTSIDDLLTGESSVSDYQVEPTIMVTKDNFSADGEEIFDFNNVDVILSLNEAQQLLARLQQYRKKRQWPWALYMPSAYAQNGW